MSTTIIDFWKANRQFWITPPSKQKEVDAIIYEKFWNCCIESENLIGQVIYLDQFSRHFARLELLSEFEVECFRYQAADKIRRNILDLNQMDEVEIIFALMPFKHIEHYNFIFEYLHSYWLKDRKISEFPDLQKFYIDTYKKAFTPDTVKRDLIKEHIFESSYDSNRICDYYPARYLNPDWNVNGLEGNPLLKLLNIQRKVTVSLSGGVDSMVLAALLKYNNVDVSAVHIVYGNRAESEDEYHFLAEYCQKLSVPLYVYKIKWLRRGEIDRQFYEDMTRDLRFMTYNAVSDGEPCIILGHIKDDIVENIWTNIAHCHHLGNLKKMEIEEVQLGIRILRPFLNVNKAEIYKVSEQLAIPYLKNTTPSWSNRGKFRETFHAATITQFGESIDEKIVEFAEAVQAQNKLLNMLLYDPIYDSFSGNKVNITTAVKAHLDANSWLNIFEHICHKKLGISRPCISAIRDFHKRLNSKWSQLNIELGKKLKIKVNKSGTEYYMEFI